MKKKHFIIIIAVLTILLGSLIALVIVKNNNSSEEEISEELRIARETFDVRLSSDKSEYIIYDLKKSANIDGASIVIPDSIDNIPVTKLIDKDLKNFSSYNNVASITLGKNISFIGISLSGSESLMYGENIFSGAIRLTNISVSEENSVFSSENGVLYNKNKTVLIKYPMNKRLTDSMANHTFTIPNSVVDVYQKAFFQNTSIDTIVFGENVEKIMNEAFANCTSLTSVKFNSKLKSIMNRAFEGCSNLDGVELKEGVLEIKYHAFYDCNKLSSIYIPESLITLDASVFIGCNKLNKIYTTESNVSNLKDILTNSKHTELVDKITVK